MSTIGPEGSNENFVSEDELKSLLERWIAPQPSKTLDQRVANSYHREMGSAGAVSAAAQFPQSQNEVVKMKFCSTCKEEFADKFGFCPVDGTPLDMLVSKAQDNSDSFASAGAPKANVSSANVPVEPLDIGEPVMAGAMALVRRGELHLTIIDDAGLVGRLAKEVSDVAHQYQLTWPEFKRDPFGFTKRSLVGYGQMASKFFGNRNIIAGLIVAVIAMVALVGIMALLDRAQPGGISRSGFVTFAAIALVILAGIFITWLGKSRSGAVLGAPEGESNNAVLGMVVAFSFFLVLVGGGVLFNVWQKREARQQATEQLVVENFIDIPTDQPTPEEGPAGLNKGKGGGSKPKQEKPGGGGGGGREEQKPASFGKTPQASLTVPPIVAPDPHPPTIKNPVLPVAATLVGDPMLIPPDARNLQYGDPKSKSTDPSSGPGTGNGIGTGTGAGIGSGEGGGLGPGRGGNTGGGDYHEGGGGPGGGGGGDYNRTFSPKEVTQKARVISKPEPQYTEEARKNQVTGTVILRAIFSSSGQVTNISARAGLPYGLTERAIAAARQIKFTPATKDGHPVSMYIQLEYNFNLY
ncbi:MAG TPA: energy transducer TonB [Pyrinomonadaceae bacterium]|jgi:TonB family protein|nr:energy transducer TonB [Pyrinomonadaceae bacterium]